MIDIPALLARQFASIDELLRRELPEEAARFLSESVWYHMQTGGKRLRPALCLLTCEALRGDPRKALPFALATELLHNMLLVHDDIEDGDTVRRDKPTLWVHAGIPNAINVGDYLLARAYRILLEAPLEAEVNLRLARIFSLAYERTVEGQALDINLRGNIDFTLASYLEIVQLKTAYYLAVTWVGGAVVAGIDARVEEALWELGRCLGPAFQIRDDVIDLTHGKGRGGEVGCDLKEGKPSILFAYVIERAKGAPRDRDRLVEILRKPRESTTDDDVGWAIRFYRETGALEFAEAKARELTERASGVIEALPLGTEDKEVFHALSRFMIDRKT